MNILVTGANGQLGNEMRIIARESDDHYVFTDVNQVEGVETGFLDITDLEAVRKMVAAQRVVRETKRQCAEGEYPLKDTRLYFALMKANDHLIELGQLNPFNGNSYNSSLKAEYAPGQMVQAGVPCHSEGAPVYINCHTYDFTEFAKIVFLAEKDYMAIRKQAYGF